MNIYYLEAMGTLAYGIGMKMPKITSVSYGMHSCKVHITNQLQIGEKEGIASFNSIHKS